MLTHQERVKRYEEMRREGRLLRCAWTRTDVDGRERACWLAALSPEAAEAEYAQACPADVMPAWLACLTLDLDDNVSRDRWGESAERYGRCAASWPTLDDAAWSRVEVKVKLAVLAIAREAVSADEWDVLAAIDATYQHLLEGGPEERGPALRAGARRAACAAEAVDAFKAAICAISATESHAFSVAGAAASAASAASVAASVASHAADAEVAAAAAEATTYDRIAVALFDAIEHEIASTTTPSPGDP